MTIVTFDTWSAKAVGAEFRLIRSPTRGLCLLRKSYSPRCFGGYQIHEAVLNSQIGREWVEVYDLSINKELT